MVGFVYERYGSTRTACNGRATIRFDQFAEGRRGPADRPASSGLLWPDDRLRASADAIADRLA